LFETTNILLNVC